MKLGGSNNFDNQFNLNFEELFYYFSSFMY